MDTGAVWDYVGVSSESGKENGNYYPGPPTTAYIELQYPYIEPRVLDTLYPNIGNDLG